MGCCWSAPTGPPNDGETKDGEAANPVVSQVLGAATTTGLQLPGTASPISETQSDTTLKRPASLRGHTAAVRTPTPIPAEDQAPVEPSLWDMAHTKVQNENTKLVAAFENILLRVDFESEVLSLKDGDHPGPSDEVTDKNARLTKAIHQGLEKTKKWASAMEKMSDISSVLSYVGNIIQDTLSATVPQIGAAWLGVSILLKGLSRAAEQSVVNREGIIYIGSRASWYQKLFSIRNNMGEGKLDELALELDGLLTDLLAMVITYQMKSVCEYYRSQIAVVLSDAVTITTWEDELRQIKAREEDVCRCLEQYDRKAGLELLQGLSRTSKAVAKIELGMATQLEKIASLQQERLDAEKKKEDAKRRKADQDLRDRADKLIGKFSIAGLNYDEFMDRNPGPVEGTCSWFTGDPRVKDWEYALNIEAYINREGEALTKSTTRLWGLLEVVASHASAEGTPIICVLDALDECNEDDRRMLLHNITAFCKPEQDRMKPNLRVLLTTRPINTIVNQLDDVPKIALDPKENPGVLSSEIDKVIEVKVDKMARAPSKRWSTDLCVKIKQLLRARGTQLTYLWLRLVFELLEDESDLPDEDWIDLVTKLPPTLNGIYERLLEKVRSRMQTAVRELLSIMLCTLRPLEVEEMHVALSAALAVSDKRGALTKTYLPTHEKFKKWVDSHCGFFVQIYGNEVQFIHQTAKEFLTEQPGETQGKPQWQGTFEMKAAHQRMRDLCCQYLAYRTRFWKDRTQEKSCLPAEWFFPEVEDRLDGLVPYAIQFRKWHNRECGAIENDDTYGTTLFDIAPDSSIISTAPLATCLFSFESSLRAHKYAYDCLETLKQYCTGENLDGDGGERDHFGSPDIESNDSGTMPSNSDLEKRTRQFLRDILYSGGNSKKAVISILKEKPSRR
ncbi:hypothetical protein QBC40DRAFT_322923 [Triangularia verruculosa]|uniref:NWD NACHT-NTPase N-terminal domain-containing protein n=1 Tax=Triangularia verruculosa TaxID=2587418 RepID=A0AAN6XNP4_9PEZI|nr:hypothetical protein QBC40DRAFT_322923 [Triangularia verruculosa]